MKSLLNMFNLNKKWINYALEVMFSIKGQVKFGFSFKKTVS
jgi:hypothetical protein